MAALTEVLVPDIGDYSDVPVIEVLVAPGDRVHPESPLIVLESEKATMEVPSTAAGTVATISVGVGDTVSAGDLILTLEGADEASAPTADTPATADERTSSDDDPPSPPGDSGDDAAGDATPPDRRASPEGHRPDDSDGEPRQVAAPDDADAPDTSVVGAPAGPAARRLARSLGVELATLAGSGRGGRITLEDVARAASGADAAGAATPQGPVSALPGWPSLDFDAFGTTERVPLSRIAKIAGPALHRNWVGIPHVTQFDEADITDLDVFRRTISAEQPDDGPKITMVALLVKACAVALRRFPHFNSSLDGDSLIVKDYVHIGFAADTPAGLMVPVIRDADTKGVVEIARQVGELAAAARDGSITREQMAGGSFTISSLGGIGGTAFTPIINAPEVAILGVSRSQTRPVWDGERFEPRLMLPLSLSYDHRVIDGADAARFTSHLGALLAEPARMLL